MHEKLTLDRVTPPKSETMSIRKHILIATRNKKSTKMPGVVGGVAAGKTVLLITGLRYWSFAFFNIGLLVTKGQGKGILVWILFFTTMAVNNYADLKVSQMGTYGSFHAT